MALKITYWTLTLLLFFSLGLFFERPAHAYADPGTCLLLFQSLGAIASGALFYFRRRLKKLFTRSQPKSEAVSTPVIMSRADS